MPVAHFATSRRSTQPIGSLAGQRLVDVRRRAKRLLFEAEDGNTPGAPPDERRQARRLADAGQEPAVLAVGFEGGLNLVMTESGRKRRAAAWLWTPEVLAEELAHIGPEPLDPAFTVDALARSLHDHPHQLHAFLRDQRAIAGIGRAFANEILHAAMLSPYQRTATLDETIRGTTARGHRGSARGRRFAPGAALGEWSYH